MVGKEKVGLQRRSNCCGNRWICSLYLFPSQIGTFKKRGRTHRAGRAHSNAHHWTNNLECSLLPRTNRRYLRFHQYRSVREQEVIRRGTRVFNFYSKYSRTVLGVGLLRKFFTLRSNIYDI